METAGIQGLEIFGVGQWNGDKYAESDLYEMIDAFGKVGFKPTIKCGHAEGQEDEKKARKVFGAPALGYVDKLHVRGGKLLADLVNIPKRFAELIKAGAYKRVSSEIYWNYKDESRGSVFPRVLKSVAFLGADIPAITSLKEIESLYHDGREYRRYEIRKEKQMQSFPTVEYFQACNEAARHRVMLLVDKLAHERMRKDNCDYRTALQRNFEDEKAQAKQYGMGGTVEGDGVGDFPRGRDANENKLQEFLAYNFDQVSYECGVFLEREAKTLIASGRYNAIGSQSSAVLRAAFSDARAAYPQVARSYDVGAWSESVVKIVFARHFK